MAKKLKQRFSFLLLLKSKNTLATIINIIIFKKNKKTLIQDHLLKLLAKKLL